MSKPIHTNYFDREGNGPATISIELKTFPPLHPDEDATLGLFFRLIGYAFIDHPGNAGFFFGPHGRENVAELHAQLGQWLAENPSKEPTGV